MASKREVVVATENYLRSKGYNNSTGKYDRVIMGVKSLLGETLLAYGSPEFERAIQQETERMLKKYVKDSAMEYDPIMCMMVPKKAEDAKTWVVEYEDALGDNHKKTFADKTAVEKFIRRGTDVGKAYHLKVNGKAVNNTATWTADAKAEDTSMVYDEVMAMMKSVTAKDKRTADYSGFTSIANYFEKECKEAIKKATPETAEKLFMELQKKEQSVLNDMNDTFNSISKELTESRTKIRSMFMDANNKLFAIHNKR